MHTVTCKKIQNSRSRDIELRALYLTQPSVTILGNRQRCMMIARIYNQVPNTLRMTLYG